jgi:8-oxo-dGTP diphosphatase
VHFLHALLQFLLNEMTQGSGGMAGKTIHAAGGIVVRNGARPLIAIVQRAKDEHWVLPRGKLKLNESPLAGARREVIEETGHRVRVREFLGAISYRARGRPKVVQFWHMQAAVNPSRDLMKDIMAVEWLPLSAAVRRLSYPLEKLFLRNVGRMALRQRKRHPRRKTRGHIAKAKARRHAAKTHKSRLHRVTVSRGSSRKRAGHLAARLGQANLLQRVLGRLSP